MIVEPKTSMLFVAWLVWLASLSFMPIVDARNVKMQASRTAGAERTAGTERSDAQAQQEVQILQDHIMMLWIGMGAIGGGYVCVTVKTIRLKQLKVTDPSLSTRMGVVAYASVGTITSILASPWVIKKYMNPGVNGNGIESIPLVSFLVAFLIWFALEVGEILYNRLRDRAKKDGLAGIKDELSGRILVTPAEPQPVREEKTKS